MLANTGFATLVLLALVFMKTGNCVPSYVTCPNPDPLDRTVFYPHESNCTEFYRCDHGSPLLQYCPGGLHWNPTLDTCDWPWNAGCSPGSGSGGSGGGCGGSGGGGTGSCPAGNTPTCPNPDPAYSVFFPHENDCHWFYHCSNGVAYCKVCPAGLHWNTDLDTCDWPWHAGCGSTGGIRKSPVSGSCPVPQPGFNIYFPDLSDCSNFYQCSHGVAYQQKCPAGLHFNSRLNVCDYPAAAGCDVDIGGNVDQPEVPPSSCPPATPPKCSVTNPDVSVYFPHPSDAHWFYQCSYGVAYCKICPAGLKWNQQLQRCDW